MPRRLNRNREPLEVVDSSDLTDADWAIINQVRRVHETGDEKALSRLLDKLAAADQIRFLTAMYAFFPELVRDTIRDQLAEAGITVEDVREIIQKLERPGPLQ